MQSQLLRRVMVAVATALSVGASSAAVALDPPPANPWVEGCLRTVDWTGPKGTFAACYAQATSESRFGDVAVFFVPEEERVEIVATRGLGPRYADCVRQQLARRSCLLKPSRDASAWEWPRLYDVQLGAVRPSLPAADELVARWEKLQGASWFLTRSSAARGLRRSLSPDVAVLDDGCLWHPSTTALLEADRVWFRAWGREIAPPWRDVLSRSVGDGNRHDAWLWLARDRLVSIDSRPLVPSSDPIPLSAQIDQRVGSEGTLLCLQTFDAATKDRLGAAIKDLGDGWVGGFDEILTNPRVGLPDGKRFVDLALLSAGLCGLDEARTVTCVGKRPLPPLK